MLQVTKTEEIESESLVRLRLITHNARLVDSRKARGMTQVDMAQAIGTRQLRISEIETLKDIPTEDEMVDISCILEKPIDYLFPEELLPAVKAGVFSRRKVELDAPQVISLTEAQHLRLAYDGETALIEEASKNLLTDQMAEVLNTLKPREQRVLRLRFGFDDGRSRTLEETAIETDWGVTRERIRQIEALALRKLRHPARSRKLKDYLD